MHLFVTLFNHLGLNPCSFLPHAVHDLLRFRAQRRLWLIKAEVEGWRRHGLRRNGVSLQRCSVRVRCDCDLGRRFYEAGWWIGAKGPKIDLLCALIRLARVHLASRWRNARHSLRSLECRTKICKTCKLWCSVRNDRRRHDCIHVHWCLRG